MQAVRRFRNCPLRRCTPQVVCVCLCVCVQRRWLTGPYCRLCNVSDGSRYYDSEESECLVCEGNAAAPLLLGCGALLALIIVVLFFVRFQPHRHVPSLIRLAHWLARLFDQLSLRSKCKQLLGFYQERLTLTLAPTLTPNP